MTSTSNPSSGPDQGAIRAALEQILGELSLGADDVRAEAMLCGEETHLTRYERESLASHAARAILALGVHQWAASDKTSIELGQWPTHSQVRATRESALADFVHDGDDVLLTRTVLVPAWKEASAGAAERAPSSRHQPANPTQGGLMQHLVTFLVDVPEDLEDIDFDEVREQVGSGAAEIYKDEVIDQSFFQEQEL